MSIVATLLCVLPFISFAEHHSQSRIRWYEDSPEISSNILALSQHKEYPLRDEQQPHGDSVFFPPPLPSSNSVEDPRWIARVAATASEQPACATAPCWQPASSAAQPGKAPPPAAEAAHRPHSRHLASAQDGDGSFLELGGSSMPILDFHTGTLDIQLLPGGDDAAAAPAAPAATLPTHRSILPPPPGPPEGGGGIGSASWLWPEGRVTTAVPPSAADTTAPLDGQQT